MKSSFTLLSVSLSLLVLGWPLHGATLPETLPLWGDRLVENPIQYPDGEKVREPKASPTAPSGKNRVISQVAVPTYTIHRPPANLANGVGLVICPGGGYVDVWLDREGNDLAIWLAGRGITSLVLKYRTNGRTEERERRYDWETYLKAVFADARGAVAHLRSQADELGLDRNKIGISGFSAGGHLAFGSACDPQAGTATAAEQVNFLGLFYPWLWEGFEEVARGAVQIPPTFIMNGAPDTVTPAKHCLTLSQILLEKEIPVELHIFRKGNHGFDLGEGHGQSPALWKVSFVAWLQDLGFISYQD